MMNVRLLNGPSGIGQAIKGMRMSFDSDTQTDSLTVDGERVIGPKDKELMLRLIKSGADHSAFMRMIITWWDVTMPMHWWKQMDKYRFGVEVRSRSTMHQIMKRPLTTSDFTDEVSEVLINDLNRAIAAGDFTWVINNLPMGYLQNRLVMTSMQALRHILKSRKGHRNTAWSFFTDEVLRQMPDYSMFLV